MNRILIVLVCSICLVAIAQDSSRTLGSVVRDLRKKRETEQRQKAEDVGKIMKERSESVNNKQPAQFTEPVYVGSDDGEISAASIRGDQLGSLMERMTGVKHGPGGSSPLTNSEAGPASAFFQTANDVLHRGKGAPNSFQLIQETFGKANVEDMVKSGISEKEILLRLREQSIDNSQRREKLKFKPTKKPNGVEIVLPEEALTRDQELPAEEIVPEYRNQGAPKLKKKKSKPMFDRNSFNFTERTKTLLSEFLTNTTHEQTILNLWAEQRTPILAGIFSVFTGSALFLATQRWSNLVYYLRSSSNLWLSSVCGTIFALSLMMPQGPLEILEETKMLDSFLYFIIVNALVSAVLSFFAVSKLTIGNVIQFISSSAFVYHLYLHSFGKDAKWLEVMCGFYALFSMFQYLLNVFQLSLISKSKKQQTKSESNKEDQDASNYNSTSTSDHQTPKKSVGKSNNNTPIKRENAVKSPQVKGEKTVLNNSEDIKQEQDD